MLHLRRAGSAACVMVMVMMVAGRSRSAVGRGGALGLSSRATLAGRSGARLTALAAAILGGLHI